MKMLKFIIIFTCFSFLTGIWMNFSLPGQIKGGVIYGKIVGLDENVIPGVLVILTGEKVVRLERTTNNEGIFRFSGLPPGVYDVTVSLAGFKTVVKKNIHLSSGSSQELTINMGMMTIKEEVVVSASNLAAEIIVLENNYGINPYKKKAVPKNDSNFYYMENKLFAIYGVAKVSSTKEELKDINITEIPYKPEDYHTSGLDIIPRGVYVIKLDKRGRELLYIRILEILKGKIKVEYHLPE